MLDTPSPIAFVQFTIIAAVRVPRVFGAAESE
jgi:hypothetical protein